MADCSPGMVLVAQRGSVRGGLAFVTAREDGLFIVDVRKLDAPALLCHYDTIERATGIALSRGKYAVVARGEKRAIGDLTYFSIQGHPLSGKPTIDGTTLYLSNRVLGTVQAVDISQIENPRLLAQLQLDEHPSPAVVHNRHLLIPAGYQGLLVWPLD